MYWFDRFLLGKSEPETILFTIKKGGSYTFSHPIMGGFLHGLLYQLDRDSDALMVGRGNHLAFQACSCENSGLFPMLPFLLGFPIFSQFPPKKKVFGVFEAGLLVVATIEDTGILYHDFTP